MTEKRFVMKDPNDWGYPITDNVTGKVYSCNSNILMKDFCKVVNDIVDENEQLKIKISDLRYDNKNLKTNLGSSNKERKELLKENEELKRVCKVLIEHIEENSIAFIIDKDVRRLLE